jgi:hypothetical protein
MSRFARAYTQLFAFFPLLFCLVSLALRFLLAMRFSAYSHYEASEMSKRALMRTSFSPTVLSIAPPKKYWLLIPFIFTMLYIAAEPFLFVLGWEAYLDVG